MLNLISAFISIKNSIKTLTTNVLQRKDFFKFIINKIIKIQTTIKLQVKTENKTNKVNGKPTSSFVYL